MSEGEPLLFPTPTAVWRPMEGNVRLLRAKVLAGEMTEQEATAMIGKSPMEQQGKVPYLFPTPQASDWVEGARTAPDSRQVCLGRSIRRGELTSSRAASPASPSAPQESAEERTILATSGRKCCALLKSSSPLGSLARTLLASWAWDLTLRSLAWKAKGTKQRRLWFQLLLSARRTSGNECSLWPTICASGNRNSRNAILCEGEAHQKHGQAMGLEQVVEVTEGIVPKELESEQEIPVFYQPLWPTATAHEAKGARLPETMAKTGRNPMTNSLGDAVMHVEGGRLNPDWVELLMGFPAGWTRLENKPSGKAIGKAKRPGSRKRETMSPTASKPSATLVCQAKSTPSSRRLQT